MRLSVILSTLLLLGMISSVSAADFFAWTLIGGEDPKTIENSIQGEHYAAGYSFSWDASYEIDEDAAYHGDSIFPQDTSAMAIAMGSGDRMGSVYTETYTDVMVMDGLGFNVAFALGNGFGLD